MNNVFVNPLTEYDYYWLGFLMADGYVCNTYKNKSIELGLHKRDTLHVEKFKEFVGSTNTIQYKLNSTKITVYSKTLVNKLETYGVVTRKSHIAEALLDIDTSRHFWRGIIDGNGSIGVWNQNQRGYHYERPIIQLVGSLYIINQFCRFITPLKINLSPIKHKSIFGTSISGERALNLIKLLYEDCNMFLDRKYERYIELAQKFNY